MLVKLRLDCRASECFHALGVNWLNTYWRRVQLGALSIALLEQRGLAYVILRACAERLGDSYSSWVKELRRNAADEVNTARVHCVRRRASDIAGRRRLLHWHGTSVSSVPRP